MKDQPKPRIISLEVDGKDWLVNDNGPGIPERYHKSIFEVGFTTKPGGRGLGLYVARQVLNRHGFEISVDKNSKLGRGTTFRISESQETANDD